MGLVIMATACGKVMVLSHLQFHFQSLRQIRKVLKRCILYREQQKT